MVPRIVYGYYWFGTCMRYLQDVQAGSLVGPIDRDWHVLSNLQRFFTYLDELDLQVTSRAASDLRRILEELEERKSTDELSVNEAHRLSKAATEIRKTLEAEIRGYEAYVVTPKRIDVRRLLRDVPSLFAPDTYAKLSSIAQYDLDEAAKCIAFERSTAAAFHVLRATEAVLRDFYRSLARRKRVQLYWGLMVADLRKRRKADKYSVLLAHLDNIRLSFRNPTQHPEATYDIHEVQDLWSVCVDALNRMATEL